ncbi:MAG: hypothetical protein AAF798_16055 [Bacteroidota bacterium]
MNQNISNLRAIAEEILHTPIQSQAGQWIKQQARAYEVDLVPTLQKSIDEVNDFLQSYDDHKDRIAQLIAEWQIGDTSAPEQIKAITSILFIELKTAQMNTNVAINKLVPFRTSLDEVDRVIKEEQKRNNRAIQEQSQAIMRNTARLRQLRSEYQRAVYGPMKMLDTFLRQLLSAITNLEFDTEKLERQRDAAYRARTEAFNIKGALQRFYHYFDQLDDLGQDLVVGLNFTHNYLKDANAALTTADNAPNRVILFKAPFEHFAKNVMTIKESLHLRSAAPAA